MKTPSQKHLESAMREAFAEAESAKVEGEFPYGAVIMANDGRILSAAQDRVLRDNDPTAHAEIGAVRRAIAVAGKDLSGCALVSNVEPCAMCATAAWWANISLVSFGISQADLFDLRPDSMDEPGLTVEQTQMAFSRKMLVVPNLKKDEALKIWIESRLT